MKIIVCMKQVPVQASLLRINSDSSWIEEDELSYEINESDHYGLEEALRLKEKMGGEVVLLGMGPGRLKESIKDGLAMGADRALYIDNSGFSRVDPFINGKILAAAVRPESPDLVVTGLQSDDHGFGQTGVVLAELLGLAHATIVMEIQPQNDRIRVKRELESGWFQWIELPLPALLTIQSGLNQIRYVTIKGIMAAKKKEIRELTLGDLGLGEADVAAGSSGLGLKKVYIPQKSKKAQIFDGDAAEAAAQLAGKLKTEAKVL